MTTVGASAAEDKTDLTTAEVQESIDLGDDPSRGVTQKKQSLSDLFTIVSAHLIAWDQPFFLVACSPLLINGSVEREKVNSLPVVLP